MVQVVHQGLFLRSCLGHPYKKERLHLKYLFMVSGQLSKAAVWDSPTMEQFSLTFDSPSKVSQISQEEKSHSPHCPSDQGNPSHQAGHGGLEGQVGQSVQIHPDCPGISTKKGRCGICEQFPGLIQHWVRGRHCSKLIMCSVLQLWPISSVFYMVPNDRVCRLLLQWCSIKRARVVKANREEGINLAVITTCHVDAVGLGSDWVSRRTGVKYLHNVRTGGPGFPSLPGLPGIPGKPCKLKEKKECYTSVKSAHYEV